MIKQKGIVMIYLNRDEVQINDEEWPSDQQEKKCTIGGFPKPIEEVYSNPPPSPNGLCRRLDLEPSCWKIIY